VPHLVEVQKEFSSEKFIVVGLMEGDSDQAAKFISELKASYPILTEADDSFSNWGVTLLPQSYLINPEGVVVADDLDSISEILRTSL
jgi:hypothetical protein